MASVRVSMELVASSRIMTGDRRPRRAMAISWRCPWRKVRAVVGEHGVITVGQAADEVVRTGEDCGLAALVIRCVETAVADVVHDRAGEEVRVLKDKAEGAAQVSFLYLVDIYAVIADLAVGDVIEAVDEVRYRGLARACRADKATFCPGSA